MELKAGELKAGELSAAELRAALLLVAFRHEIEEPDLDSGLRRVATIAGQDGGPNAFYPLLAEALADGDIYDPVRLRPGALQCCWHLELTPSGVGKVQRLLQAHGKTADELLSGSGVSGR